MAGHVEDTVPYPEIGRNNKKKKHQPDRNDYGPETERNREIKGGRGVGAGG